MTHRKRDTAVSQLPPRHPSPDINRVISKLLLNREIESTLVSTNPTPNQAIYLWLSLKYEKQIARYMKRYL